MGWSDGVLPEPGDRSLQLVVAARFKPLTEFAKLDVVRASEIDADNEATPRVFQVKRSFHALLSMLRSYSSDPEFLDAFFGDYFDEFSGTIEGILNTWEQIADTVPGRYQALVVDNLPMVLGEPAGLGALIRDLEGALFLFRS